MFGLFKRLSGPRPPKYLVWQSDAARWEGIWPSVAGRSGDGRLLFVAHFDETLAVLHELLEQDGLIAHELDQPHRPSALCGLPPGIYVVRASLLETGHDNKVPMCNTPLKIIAIEPHVIPEPDPELRRVLSLIRGDVMYEHHASLDDLALKLFAGERTLELLTKMGFNEGDYMESGMVSRSITRAQEKIAQVPGIDPTSTSLAQWADQIGQD
ncbi:MAG: hypothetical protein AB8C95_07540 [Phycisphaeraceae bacterium]